MLAVAALLWLGAATVVSRHLAVPGFLMTGGNDVYGSHVPQDATDDSDPQKAFEAKFDGVSIDAGDNRVAGWLIPAESRTAVLLIPPAGATRAAMLPYAKFLHAAGFPVFAIDSGDTLASGTDWGVRESARALAAADWLKPRGYQKIAALGVSEGAAAALMAQAKQPAFAAIVADSPYANLGAMFRRIPSISGLNPAFVMTVMWEARLWLGRNPDSVSPVNAASHLGGVPLMIIQNRGDQTTPVSDGSAISAAAGASAEMWTAPADGHGDAIYSVPDAYDARVGQFLKGAIKEGPPKNLTPH